MHKWRLVKKERRGKRPEVIFRVKCDSCGDREAFFAAPARRLSRRLTTEALPHNLTCGAGAASGVARELRGLGL